MDNSEQANTKRPGGEAHNRPFESEEAMQTEFHSLQDKVSELQEEIGKLVQDNTRRKIDDSATESLIDKQDKLESQLDSQKEKLDDNQKKLTEESSSLKEKIEDLGARAGHAISKVSAELKALQSQKQQVFAKQIEKINQDFGKLRIDGNSKFTNLSKQYEVLQNQQLAAKQQRLEGRLETQNKQISDDLHRIENGQQHNKERHNKRIEQLHSHIKEHQSTISRLKENYDALYEEVSEFKSTKKIQDNSRNLFLGFYDDFQRDLRCLKEDRSEDITGDVGAFLSELGIGIVQVLEQLDLEKVSDKPEKYTKELAEWICVLGTEPTDRIDEDGVISNWKKDAFRRKGDGFVFRQAQVITKQYKASN